MPETTPLFQTQTTYTFAEYRRYSRALQNKVMHRPLVIAVMMACLVLLALLSDDNSMRVAFLIVAVLTPLIFSLIGFRMEKKAYYANTAMQDVVLTYSSTPGPCGYQQHAGLHHHPLRQALPRGGDPHQFLLDDRPQPGDGDRQGELLCRADRVFAEAGKISVQPSKQTGLSPMFSGTGRSVFILSGRYSCTFLCNFWGQTGY